MPSLNKVFVMGNLTRDPNLKYTPRGSAVCEFGVAVNRRYTTESGEQKEEVCFLDVDVWGKQAEYCGKSLQKGAPVFVEGRLRTDSWQDKDGNKRSRLRIVGERVQFLSGPGGRSGGTSGGDEGYDDSSSSSEQAPRQQPKYGGGSYQQSPPRAQQQRPPQQGGYQQPSSQQGQAQQFVAERQQPPPSTHPAAPQQFDEPPSMPPPEAFSPEGETEDDIPF